MIKHLARLLAAAVVATSVTVGVGGVVHAANESPFPLADPDTVLAKDGRYVTYGTTVGAGTGKRCGATGKLFVPVLVHGSGNTVGFTDCASADALPNGPGSWAEGNVWAPGVAKFGDRFFMYYTASKRGTGQKCIGRAVSSSARGPFTNPSEWACPAGGRWAIDANPYLSGGQLYVTYRDDAITSGAETGISAVRTDANGWAVWSTRRDVLKSTDITWDTRGTSGGTHVIENPSMFKSTDGYWYVAYSGNNWDSARYSTGIARCGTGPIPSARCSPRQNGVERPYFGYTGSGGLNPYRGLPGNHRGPGGMDFFNAMDGSYRVVYHWWDGGTRFPITAAVGRDAGGFYIS
jgi:arabinan endo-1,5-alpha-L-arabinosidase